MASAYLNTILHNHFPSWEEFSAEPTFSPFASTFGNFAQDTDNLRKQYFTIVNRGPAGAETFSNFLLIGRKLQINGVHTGRDDMSPLSKRPAQVINEAAFAII